jgi:hypothetical protein
MPGGIVITLERPWQLAAQAAAQAPTARTDDSRVPANVAGMARPRPAEQTGAGCRPPATGGPLRHQYAILEAPSALGHVPEHLGVERAPGVLLDAALADGLSARRAGCLPAGGYSGVPDPRTR